MAGSTSTVSKPTLPCLPDQTPRVGLLEFADRSNTELFCPFCGQLVSTVINASKDSTPCAHTLFIAHDEGWEARSPLFNKLMDTEGVEHDDIDMGDNDIDRYTDTFPDPLAVKFAFYAPSPSFMGTYVAFHPYAHPPAEGVHRTLSWTHGFAHRSRKAVVFQPKE